VPVNGTRDGKVVLVELREGEDPELGGRYTVKRYRSEKGSAEGGGWQRERIILSPDSDRGGFEAIVLGPDDAGRVRLVAEFIGTVGD
jgi:hypothetical protein